MTINQLITFNSLKPCVLILQIIHLIIPFYFKIELRLGGQINLQLYKKNCFTTVIVHKILKQRVIIDVWYLAAHPKIIQTPCRVSPESSARLSM